ncbi:MAG: YceI family protein [Alphaproteobacteria bacterium]|nr:YceI family protein [Alphaproteobacteria bacterium]
MIIRNIVVSAAASLLALAGAASAFSGSGDGAATPSGSYTLEPRHTQVEFSIVHFGITNYHGRFEKASGTLNLDVVEPQKSAVDVSVDTTSLNTQSAELNKELQGPAIFDAGHFPTATFKSARVERNGPNTGVVTGTLTIKGISRPVTFQVTFNGSTHSPMSPRTVLVGFRAETVIRRSDYNMTGTIWSPMVSDEVRLEIDAPFVLAGR